MTLNCTLILKVYVYCSVVFEVILVENEILGVVSSGAGLKHHF